MQATQKVVYNFTQPSHFATTLQNLEQTAVKNIRMVSSKGQRKSQKPTTAQGESRIKIKLPRPSVLPLAQKTKEAPFELKIVRPTT